MARDRLTTPTTAVVIRKLGLTDAPVSPDAKVAAARAAARAMTDAEWDDLQIRLDRDAMKLNASAIAVHGPRRARLLVRDGEQRSMTVLRTCPHCQATARGASDGDRADWFMDHYRSRHPEIS